MARSTSAKTAGGGKGNSRAVEANLALFSLGGPFAGYTGPALVVGPNGVILATNDAAEELAELIKAGGPPELRTALDTALNGRTAQLSPLLLDSAGMPEGQSRALELTLLPWGEGAAVLVLGRDMTLDRRLRRALIESHQRYKDLVGLLATDFAWETDAEGRFIYISPNGGLGYTADELLSSLASSHAREGESARAVFSAGRTILDQPLSLYRADGDAADMVVSATPVLSSDGSWAGTRGVCRDVTARAAAARTIDRGRNRERLLAAILRMTRDEGTPQALLDTVAAGLPAALGAEGAAIYRQVGGQYQLAARAGGQAPGKLMQQLLARLEGGEREAEDGDGQSVLLARAATRHEEVAGLFYLWQAADSEPWSDDDRALVAELTDQIGEALRRLSREEELARLAATDPLTGLANRRTFLDALSARLAGGGEAAQRPGTLLYIEATNFKLVNARRGHHTGDEVLIGLARMLRGQSGPEDVIARLEGDTFAVFLDGVSNDAAVQRARNIVKAVRNGLANETGDPVQPLGVAVGVASYDPARPEGVSDLLDRGHRAMSRKKRSGGDAVGISELRRA